MNIIGKETIHKAGTGTCLSRLAAFCLLFFFSSEAVAQTKFETRYYNVFATTENELYEAVTSRSPIRATGLTELVSGDVRYTYKGRGNQYFIDKIVINNKIIQTFPKWVNKAKGKKCLQRQWDNFSAALKKHEDNHKAKYMEYRTRLLSGVARMGPQNDPTTLQASFNSINEALKSEISAWHVQYDATTNHGQSEGVVLSACE